MVSSSNNVLDLFMRSALNKKKMPVDLFLTEYNTKWNIDVNAYIYLVVMLQ